MTKGIKTSIYKKRELYLNSRNSSDPKLKKYYKLYCKQLNKVIKEAKLLHYNEQILTSQNKTKTTWNIVKSETGKTTKKKEITLLNTEGILTQSQQTIANAFNDYFLTISEKLIEKNYTEKTTQTQIGEIMHHIPQNDRHSYPNIKFRGITTKEVEKTIKSLKTKNTQGYDEISVKILQECAPFISSPLTYIGNKSFDMGSFPSRLKYSTVEPIYKTGDRLDIANFRPISLLISFSKIFEKIIVTRIQEHIAQYQILAYEQYGFRSNISTDNASYTLINEIVTAMNDKLIVEVYSVICARLLTVSITKFYYKN